METEEDKVSFLFDNLRVDVIRYLEEYISSGRGTLDQLKARFRSTLAKKVRREIQEQIENVEALVDALEENGVIGHQKVEMLKELAQMIDLPELAKRVEEYEADCTVSFLFNNLKVDVIRYLEEYRSGRGTLDDLKDRFCSTLAEEVRREIEDVKALVDALEKNGVIGDQNVEMLKKLAQMIDLPELADRVEEYEADRAGISRRILKGFLWDLTKGAIVHVKAVLSKEEVQLAIADAILLSIYGTNPEKIQNLKPFVDLGIKVINVLKGSAVFVLKVPSLSSLKQLWRSYKDGSLKEKLKKAFNEMEEIKELSQGEEIDVEVTIDEEEYREVRLDLILMEMKERNTVVTSCASPKKENVNFARLCRLLVDGGTRVLRDVFDLIHSPSTLHATLLSAPVHSTLKGLRANRVLTKQQWNKLYPASKSTPVTSASFDITLLFVLLRNICGLTPPPTGWNKPPVVTDLSREADLARVKYYRNELYGHTTETAVSDSEFEKYWKEISEVLVRLGGPQHDEQIKMLKIGSMDVEEEKYFTKILEDWEQAERSLKTTIENTGQSLETTVKNTEQSLESIENTRQKQTILEGQSRRQENMEKQAALQQTTVEGLARLHENMKKQAALQQTTVECLARLHENMKKQADLQQAMVEDLARLLKESLKVQKTGDLHAEKNVSFRAKEYSEILKGSIKRETDFLLTSKEEDKKIGTDDIFTNVTIVRGKKQFKEPQEHRLYETNIPRPSEVQASSTKLKTCSEMFVCPGNDDQKSTASVTINPKSILVTGKAGIGKSLFCKKLVRDWAENTLFKDIQEDVKVPDFQFVVLLTSSQLSKPQKDQGDEKEELTNLRDMLNRSCILDENSRIDESLLQYIIENPEKLLIIIDGYDEYTGRKKITGDFETRYENDAREKMPVPALIAKIMKGKMLKESVVLISSRPGEAEELKKIVFDVRCHIEGFSPPQVLEYIEKYFKDNESMKKRVLDHIKTNEILLSFANIPVMCFLMCYCIKWYMTQSKTTEKLPVTKTELYYQVIILFLKKHSSSRYEEMEETKIQELMHKLAELAMSLTIQGKYVFDENYLKQFKLTEDEITNLKASGLLDCCAGVRKTPSEKPPLQFTFTHLTIQEFFTSWLLVEKKQIPEKEKTSDVTFMFMAGLCSMKNNEKLMEELIEKIKPKDEYDYRYRVCLLSCLYEYKDSVFSTRIIKHHQHTYCNRDGWIRLSRITDIDCLYISYLLDIVYLINEEQATQHSLFRHSFIVNTLSIGLSSLSASGIRMLCNSLVRISTVTVLGLVGCELDDECVKIICNVLSGTNITHLSLSHNNITDVGVQCLCRVLESGVCRVKVLWLSGNDEITAGCKEDARKQIPRVKWIF